MRRAKFRRVGAIACALTLAPLAACGGGGGAGDSGSQGKTQIVYRLWDKEQKQRYQKIVAAFEKKHSNIDVKIELLPWSAYWKKLTTEAAAGTAPDVFKVLPSRFATYVRKGMLMDLSPVVEKHGIDSGAYREIAWKSYQYKGKMYAIPADQGVQVMYYNKDLFKKVGVTMPDKLTWDPQGSGSFVALMKKLTVDKQGRHPGEPGFDPKHVKRWGFASWNHFGSQWSNWVRDNGGRLIDHPYGKWTLDGPKSVEALTWAVDLITRWHVSPPASMTNPPSGQATEMFQRGQVAVFPGSNALVSFIAPDSNFDIGVAKMPVGPAGRFSSSHGAGEVVFAGTDHPEAAKKFVAFLGSKQARRVTASAGGSIPAIKSLAPLYVKYWKSKGVDMSPATGQMSAGATFAVPVVANYDASVGEIKPVLNQMYLGQLSPKEATDRAVREANDAISSG
ncbi:MAG: ABC transporter substrate-binding protein [Streptosporangiaceae bacterium]